MFSPKVLATIGLVGLIIAFLVIGSALGPDTKVSAQSADTTTVLAQASLSVTPGPTATTTPSPTPAETETQTMQPSATGTPIIYRTPKSFDYAHPTDDTTGIMWTMTPMPGTDNLLAFATDTPQSVLDKLFKDSEDDLYAVEAGPNRFHLGNKFGDYRAIDAAPGVTPSPVPVQQGVWPGGVVPAKVSAKLIGCYSASDCFVEVDYLGVLLVQFTSATQYRVLANNMGDLYPFRVEMVWNNGKGKWLLYNVDVEIPVPLPTVSSTPSPTARS